jgi:peptide chain release factor 3
VTRVDGAPLDLDALSGTVEALVLLDVRDRPVVLFEGTWALHTAERFHPELRFAETATGVVVRAA